jgi:hypothetical protein
MKSAFFSFAVTAALLSLNVLPSVWPAQKQTAAEARHTGEDKAHLEAELGLEA